MEKKYQSQKADLGQGISIARSGSELAYTLHLALCTLAVGCIIQGGCILHNRVREHMSKSVESRTKSKLDIHEKQHTRHPQNKSFLSVAMHTKNKNIIDLKTLFSNYKYFYPEQSFATTKINSTGFYNFITNAVPCTHLKPLSCCVIKVWRYTFIFRKEILHKIYASLNRRKSPTKTSAYTISCKIIERLDSSTMEIRITKTKPCDLTLSSYCKSR